MWHNCSTPKCTGSKRDMLSNLSPLEAGMTIDEFHRAQQRNGGAVNSTTAAEHESSCSASCDSSDDDMKEDLTSTIVNLKVKVAELQTELDMSNQRSRRAALDAQKICQERDGLKADLKVITKERDLLRKIVCAKVQCDQMDMSNQRSRRDALDAQKICEERDGLEADLKVITKERDLLKQIVCAKVQCDQMDMSNQRSRRAALDAQKICQERDGRKADLKVITKERDLLKQIVCAKVQCDQMDISNQRSCKVSCDEQKICEERDELKAHLEDITKERDMLKQIVRGLKSSLVGMQLNMRQLHKENTEYRVRLEAAEIQSETERRRYGKLKSSAKDPVGIMCSWKLEDDIVHALTSSPDDVHASRSRPTATALDAQNYPRRGFEEVSCPTEMDAHHPRQGFEKKEDLAILAKMPSSLRVSDMLPNASSSSSTSPKALDAQNHARQGIEKVSSPTALDKQQHPRQEFKEEEDLAIPAKVTPPSLLRRYSDHLLKGGNEKNSSVSDMILKASSSSTTSPSCTDRKFAKSSKRRAVHVASKAA